MTFPSRLAAAFALAIFSLIVVGIISYQRAAAVDDVRIWARHSNVILGRLSALESGIERSEDISFEFAGTRDPAALERLRQSRADISLVLKDLSSLVADNSAQVQRSAVLAPAVARFLDLLQASIENPPIAHSAAADPRAILALRVSLLDQILGTATQMKVEEDRLLLLRRHAMDEGSARVSNFIVAGYSSAILLLIFCMSILHQEMKKRAAVQSELLAAHEELETRVRRRTEDFRAVNLALQAEIEQRRRAQLEIQQLNASLEKRVDERTLALTLSNKELDTFCYSVSHDLRAPLRHVDGFSRILQEEFASQLSEDARRNLDRISNAVTQMGRLIDDLLDLSRIGRKELVRKRVDTNAVVAQIVDDLRSAGQVRDISWSIEPLPEMNCDPGLLNLVFSNLILNAVKFTRRTPSPAIQIGSVPSQEGPVLFVRDNGVGFDPQYADKLFGVFQRLHRQEDFEGTGIGLATVQRIVHRHGGSVRAESQPGHGAAFHFTLGLGADAFHELETEKVNHG